MLWWKTRRRTEEVVGRSEDVRNQTEDTFKILAKTVVQLHHATNRVEEALKEISDQPAE